MAAASRARLVGPAWSNWPCVQRTQWALRFTQLVRRDAPLLARMAVPTSGLCSRDVMADQRNAFSTRHKGWKRTPQAQTGKASPAHVLLSLSDDAAPLTHVFHGVLPALLHGDCVISAVAPHAVRMSAHVRALALETGLPGDVWQQLAGHDRRLLWAVAEHTDGSVTACCTPRSAPGSTTLPGLFVVRKDARLRPAVQDAVRSAFRSAGRHCRATPVMAVHAHHYDRFIELFAAEARALGERAARSPEAVLSRLATADELGAVRSYLTRAWGEDTQVVAKGESLGHKLHGPTVFSQRHLDRIDTTLIPPGPVAVVAPFTAWSEVLWAARGTGRHATVHTGAPLSQLAPQFATLRVDDVRLVRPLFSLRR
ncbi:aldehyde dehydrogenase family protein [Streptomyces sp. HNM0663]|uniref:Aldehyde dehydrogenase family protein n=1 Tax=Streptomyces chengmaiensis TaxID=3040919 RepID=A0ABT6HIT0_9ACTN|nr:aldehyde dehydrogenase family protein [Streptomyces chengmaiensis]MDH2388506.1 aldehyde dehydrogenase family protein [Streptomyces chengmaiensis]